MKITWGELEEGMKIVGGYEVVDLTADTITVDGPKGLQSFTRKDPWEEVEIEAMVIGQVIDAFGAKTHPIVMETADETLYFDWPNDPRFINAAQSHLVREHGTDPDGRDYEALVRLHDEMHAAGGASHTHIGRAILHEGEETA